MKVKKIKIGIKDVKTALDDFVKTGETIEQGKRLELLHIIKTRKPSSINELARFAKRNIKNVADDLKYLGQIGLIEREETDRKTKPVIHYDRIALEIAV